MTIVVLIRNGGTYRPPVSSMSYNPAENSVLLTTVSLIGNQSKCLLQFFSVILFIYLFYFVFCLLFSFSFFLFFYFSLLLAYFLLL